MTDRRKIQHDDDRQIQGTNAALNIKEGDLSHVALKQDSFGVQDIKFTKDSTTPRSNKRGQLEPIKSKRRNADETQIIQGKTNDVLVAEQKMIEKKNNTITADEPVEVKERDSRFETRNDHTVLPEISKLNNNDLTYQELQNINDLKAETAKKRAKKAKKIKQENQNLKVNPKPQSSNDKIMFSFNENVQKSKNIDDQATDSENHLDLDFGTHVNQRRISKDKINYMENSQEELIPNIARGDSMSQSNGSRGMNKRRGWKAIEKEKMDEARRITPQSYKNNRNVISKKSFAGDTDIDEMLSKQIQRKTISKSEGTSAANFGQLQQEFATPHDLRIQRDGTCQKPLLKQTAHSSFINLDDPHDFEDSATVRFKQYQDHFLNMTQRQHIYTQYDIISVIISYDSKFAITVLYSSQKLYFVRLYSLESEDFTEYQISGKYLKAHFVSQTSDGQIFALPYLDNGNFRILVFDCDQEYSNVNFNELLDIDNSTVSVNGIHDPIINACFIDDNSIFVNLFHKTTTTNWHFIYNFREDKIIGEAISTKMDCQQLNFPVSNFYDHNNNVVHCFYRHGESFTVSVDNIKKVQEQKIVEQSLGQMYFIYNKILIVNASDEILFFKQVTVVNEDCDCHSKTLKWEQYTSIKDGGFIYYIKGNTQIQITTERLIYFYRIDPDTLMPILENCIYNFMSCSQMMFGSKSRYCITYKSGQIGFNIFRRKYFHRFLVKLSQDTFEMSRGLTVNQKGVFMISMQNCIRIYDQQSLRIISEIEVPYPKFTQRECDEYKKKQEILNMKLSQNNQFLAVMVGHQLVNDESENYLLLIYQSQRGQWNICRKKYFESDELKYCSHQFEFHRKNLNELLFTNSRMVMIYNFYNDDLQPVYIFQNYLNSQPIYAVFNDSQTIAIIATFYDVLYLDIEKDQEVDIDNLYHIGDIRSVVHSNDKFYILANKCEKLLGYYLIEVDEQNPMISEPTFLINWKSKLDIGDAALFMIENKDKDTKHLMVSYKSIHINTYNVLMVNLETKLIEYRYECYHLWEANIRSVMLESHDCIIFSQEGMYVISLGARPKKIVADEQGIEWMLHSLSSCDDLILEESNHLLFKMKNDFLELSIQEQYQDDIGETFFEDIYKLKIKEMTLRELLLCQSIFSCRQQYDIVALIKLQQELEVFFISYLELEQTNLISILAFDSKSIGALLNENNEDKFGTEYPLFYQTKFHAFECDEEQQLEGQQIWKNEEPKRSAIDIALDNHQLRALNMMIEYIIKYQNTYVYSFLFEKNFMQIMSMGIHVSSLLKSKLFCYQFDFNEWPSIHMKDDQVIRPYNGSIFKLRQHYKEIFPDFCKIQRNNANKNAKNDLGNIINNALMGENKKIYKIKYTLNILPSMAEDHGTLMDTAGQTDELDIFECKALIDYIEFKWTNYAGPIHKVGATFHAMYLMVFSLFVFEIYLYKEFHSRFWLFFMMGVSLVYPTIYDFTQLRKQGFQEYLSDIWNYFDQSHIWLGYASIILHAVYQDKVIFDEHGIPKKDEEGLLAIEESKDFKRLKKGLMIVVTFILLMKTFFFLRVFKGLSHLVLMMRQVVHDLQAFMIFYAILLWVCGLIFTIIELGSFDRNMGEDFKTLKAKKSYPGVEYQYLPKFLRNTVTILRTSLGDYDFGESTYLPPHENMWYWATWVIIVVVTSIIFLNFIIAEVSTSYAIVNDQINGLIEKERSILIEEAEDMMLSKWKKNKTFFPKYLIMREIEE